MELVFPKIYITFRRILKANDKITSVLNDLQASDRSASVDATLHG